MEWSAKFSSFVTPTTNQRRGVVDVTHMEDINKRTRGRKTRTIYGGKRLEVKNTIHAVSKKVINPHSDAFLFHVHEKYKTKVYYKYIELRKE